MIRPTEQDYEEAADWIDEAADWTAERRAAFLAWLQGSVTRLPAVERMIRLMDDPALSEAIATLLAERTAPPSPLAPPLTNASPAPIGTAAAPSAGTHAPRARWRWQRPVALAASLAVVAIGTGWWHAAPVHDHFVTATGQSAVEHLADGSTVHLAPAGDLSVTLRRHTRDLSLDHGHALFEVAHAPDRPFTVQSGNMAVTAVGTVFSVDRSPAATTVRVEQGRVRVRIGGSIRYLDAGQGLALTPSGDAHPLAFHPEPALAASDEWLLADEERLDTVIARLQRQTDQPIGCAPALAGRPISGRYRLADPLSTLRLIAAANGWRLAAEGAGWRLLPG